MKINTVYVVFLQFTSAHLSSALNVMREKVLSKIDYGNITWITIDNSLENDVEIVGMSSSPYFISGDNSSREFSGFDKGIRLLDRLKPQRTDLVIFANDTFHRSYGSEYLNFVTKKKIESVLSESAVCGYVDSFPRPVHGFGKEFSSWVRTSFLMVSYSTLEKMTPFVLPSARELVFGSGVDNFFKSSAPLSENYKQYLKTWLFETAKENSEFKESWHSKVALDECNLKSMQDKAWCILCEQNLSARAFENKINIIRIND